MNAHQCARGRGTQPLSRMAKAALLLEVLLSIGALGGGIVLMIAPRGEIMPLPESALAGSPFDTYLVPGLILFSVIGLGPLVAARAHLAPAPASTVRRLRRGGWSARLGRGRGGRHRLQQRAAAAGDLRDPWRRDRVRRRAVGGRRWLASTIGSGLAEVTWRGQSTRATEAVPTARMGVSGNSRNLSPSQPSSTAIRSSPELLERMTFT